MSQDLLSEFGDVSKSPGDQKPLPPLSPRRQEFSFFDGLGGQDVWREEVERALTPTTAAVDTADDDDWGDFEAAEKVDDDPFTSKPPEVKVNDTSQTTSTELGSLVTGHMPEKTNDLGDDFVGLGITQHSAQESASTSSKPEIPAVTAPKDPNVLFDAENVSDNDDDFGDFEAVAPATQNATAAPKDHATIDLLDMFEVPKSTQSQPEQRPQHVHPIALSSGLTESTTTQQRSDDPFAIRSAGTTDLLGGLAEPEVLQQQASPALKSDFEGFDFASTTREEKRKSGEAQASEEKPKRLSKTLNAKSNPYVKVSLAEEQDEAWDDFEDWEAAPQGSQVTQAAQYGSAFTLPPYNIIAEPDANELPPANVPPPAVLLSLFPALFDEAQKDVFLPLTARAADSKHEVLADPAMTRYLESYIHLASAAAHIIAGRKQRWKRDTRLAQSMSIGPASGRSSGMKLTGIDKTESTKEDQEAVNVVKAWKDQVGRVRSTVSAVHATGKANIPSFPEIQDTMPVRTLPESEGGVAAPKQCAICGLKRNERVHRVDFNVQDSFGEWWINQVSMHKACRQFWEHHKDRLRQR